MQAERTAFHDPLRTPEMKIILDLRHTELDVELDDMRTFISLIRQLMGEGRVPEKTAIISFNKFISTLGDVFNLLADGLPITYCIFNQTRDALIWLELSEAEEQIALIRHSLLREYQN